MNPYTTTCEPGDAEWRRRLTEFLADDSEMTWWWLSFCDGDRPKGEQNLGVCLVPANNLVAAGMAAHMLKCNPGGEVAGVALPAGWIPRPEYQARLFAGDEAQRLAALEPDDLLASR